MSSLRSPRGSRTARATPTEPQAERDRRRGGGGHVDQPPGASAPPPPPPREAPDPDPNPARPGGARGGLPAGAALPHGPARQWARSLTLGPTAPLRGPPSPVPLPSPLQDWARAPNAALSVPWAGHFPFRALVDFCHLLAKAPEPWPSPPKKAPPSLQTQLRSRPPGPGAWRCDQVSTRGASSHTPT